MPIPFQSPGTQGADPHRHVAARLPVEPHDRSLVDAFRQGLRQAGLVENRDILLDIAWIGGTGSLRNGATMAPICAPASRGTWVTLEQPSLGFSSLMPTRAALRSGPFH